MNAKATTFESQGSNFACHSEISSRSHREGRPVGFNLAAYLSCVRTAYTATWRAKTLRLIPDAEVPGCVVVPRGVANIWTLNDRTIPQNHVTA